MGRKRWYKLTSLLLTVVLLATGLAGCSQASAQAEDEDAAPFYDDRVVTVRLVMDEDDWEYMQDNAIYEEYAHADLWYDGELIPDVAVRPKGSSSLTSVVQSETIRFSLKVDVNFFNSARTFYGVKKLNFNNGWSDPTLIREALAYEIFEQMGVPTPRHSFVDLWVNDSHLGLYTMVEAIDKTFLGSHFDDDSGNLYKPEMPLAYLNWTEDMLQEHLAEDSDLGEVNLGGGKLQEILEALEREEEDEAGLPGDVQLPGANRLPWGPGRENLPPGQVVSSSRGNTLIDQIGLKTNENSPDHSALFRMVEVLNTEPDETFPEEIEKVLDVDEVLRFLAVSAAIVHLDNYIGMGHNYYLYEVDGKFTFLPWDLNMAFGTYSQGIGPDGIVNFYIDEPCFGQVDDRPLLRLLSYEPYLERYHAYLEELITGPFSPEVMNGRIDELAALIRPYVVADELKFYSTEYFEIALNEDMGPPPSAGGMYPPGLKSFIAQRVESIRKQLSGELPSASGDGSGNQSMSDVERWRR